jgi:hypothetical protein
MAHLRTRVWAAATTPMVRELGPAVTNVMKTFVQFIVFMCVGCVILIVAYFSSGDIPTHVLKSACMVIGIVPMLFGFVVVGDMVYITYRQPEEVIYPEVGAFEMREPREIPEEST